MRKIWQIFILGLINAVNTATAGTLLQSHESIHETVERYVKAHLNNTSNIESVISVSAIDPRLSLTHCDEPLTAFTAPNTVFSHRFSVGVKCQGIKPWSLYIPVEVQQFTQVVVTSKPIAKGQTITLDDLQTGKHNISRLRGGYFNDLNAAVGMIAKRNLRAGKALSEKHLQPPLLIKKGDKVDIVAQGHGLEIRMEGKALTAGAKGQKIAVSNLSSKRKIEAIVVENGLVKVKM